LKELARGGNFINFPKRDDIDFYFIGKRVTDFTPVMFLRFLPIAPCSEKLTNKMVVLFAIEFNNNRAAV
jgi:hypothetical protein